MSEQQNYHRGRLEKRSITRPAAEVDCSQWVSDSDGDWHRGRLEKRAITRPAAEVDCSQWSNVPAVCLKLVVQPKPKADPVDLALALVSLIARINDLDRARGGTEFVKHSAEQTNGEVTISMVPKDSTDAVERIEYLCAQLNQAKEDRSPLAVSVQAWKISA